MASAEINVGPAQAEQLATPRAERQGDHEEGVQPVAAGGGEEGARLGIGPWLDLIVVRGRRLDESGELRAINSSRMSSLSIARSTAWTC